MSRRVIIIGGGITGLSAAFELQQTALQEGISIQCTVLESMSRFGGKVLTDHADGFVLEDGPDSILARKPEGVGLIRELGLEAELVGGNARAQKTYVLRFGKLEPLPPGTNMGIPAKIAPFATTKLLSAKGKARALLDLVLPRQKGTGDESLGLFLRRRLGNELVNNVAEPLLAGIYAGSVDSLSLQATFPQFKALETKHRSIILGSVAQRKLGARSHTKEGAFAKANKNASIAASKAGKSLFVTLAGGLNSLIERLYDALHDWADLRTDSQVVGIQRATEPNTTARYQVVVQSKTGRETLDADAVLITTPAYMAANLLSDLIPAAKRLSEILYVSTATVILAFYAHEVVVNLDASGFVVPRHEGRAITACTWVSSKWPHTTPAGYVLVRCYVGRVGQTDGLQQTDEAIVDVVRQELRDILGIEAQPAFTKVTRWDKAMPQYAVNHLELVKTVEAELEKNAPGLAIAGAGYYGLGIPDCIKQGRTAARKLMDTWVVTEP